MDQWIVTDIIDRSTATIGRILFVFIDRAILGRRLSKILTVNLLFFSYVVSTWAEFYPHFKYDVLFLICLFYERCYKINL
jgi:hypothetical protein